MTTNLLSRAALIKQEISRAFGLKLAAVPGLHDVAVTVRDDVRRGLVAEITAGTNAGLDVASAVREALWGYTVPHEVRIIGGSAA